MDCVYYFAYGRHMDPVYFKRLMIPFGLQVSACLPNYRLAFNVLEDEFFRFEKRGLANIVPDMGHRVEGVLYEIEEDDFVKLDEDIGVPSLKYYRKQVFAKGCDGVLYDAMTYAGWPDVTATGLLPSGDYINKLLKGAQKNGTSQNFRQWLESHPTTV